MRGGEVFCNIEIRMGEDGNELFVLNTDFPTKISKGGMQSNEFQTCGIIRDDVQVRAMPLKRLLALIHPSQERVFQRVLPGVRSSNGPWVCNAPLGHNSHSFSDDAFVARLWGKVIHPLH